MAWTMTGVRDALKTRLSTITPAIIVYDTVPGSPVVPCAFIAPATDRSADYHETMDGCATLRLTITVLVQRVVDAVAQDATDVYIDTTGATSIRAAVDSGSIASTWDYAVVKGASRYGQYVIGAGDNALNYLGVEFDVEVGVS